MAKEKSLPENYIQLHTHSNLSVPNDIVALPSPEEIVSAFKFKNYSAASLIDRNTMIGFYRFIDACQKNELKPIFGLEKEVDLGKGVSKSQVLIFPQNNSALDDVFKIANKNAINIDKIVELSKKSIIITSGKYLQFKDLLLNNENVFQGVNNTNSHGLEYSEHVENQTQKCVITHEIRMLSPNDIFDMKLLLRVKELNNRKLPTNRLLEHSLKSSFEINTFYNPNKYQKMINRTNDIAESINLEMPVQSEFKAQNIPNNNPEQYLVNLVINSLTQRDDTDQELIKRVNDELTLINERSLNDFFLICRDITKYCQNNQIEYSTLGSGTNSVILELLNIHDVYARDLDYTRFLNPNRSKLPDIDFEIEDIDDTQKVKNYLINKYDSFAPLTLINKLRRKTILNISTHTGINLAEEQIKSLENRNIAWVYSTHPTAFASIDHVAKNESHGKFPHQIEKETVEDVLIIPTIDILKRSTTERISLIKNELRNRNISTEIKRNDLNTLNSIFKKVNVLGISNLESPNMVNTIKSLGKILDNPNELDIANALAVSKTSYKEKERFLDKMHPFRSGLINYPEIGKILSKTNYTIFYQEQLPQIAVELAGINPKEAEDYRKLMKENLPQNTKNELLTKLKHGLLNNNYPLKIVDELIEQTQTINYSFVKGHARELAAKSYQLAFYKENYKSIFWGSIFKHLSIKPSSISYPYTLQSYINEALQMNIKFEFPTLNELEENSHLKNDSIIIGKKLFAKEFDYEKVLNDLNNPNLTHKEKLLSQIKNLGFSFTDSPIKLFEDKLHFDTKKEQQWIVGHIEGIKENKNSYFVVFESGVRLNVILPKHLYNKKSKFFKGKFWYVWLVNNDKKGNILEILDTKSINEVLK